MAKNVLGTALQTCCTKPVTGFYRDGKCETGPEDLGQHTVCAIMTLDFLEFSFNHGNDLVTPRPQFGFPGLKPGNCWCVCVGRWKEAYAAGVAPPVRLACTHEAALEVVSIDMLKQHEWQPVN